MASRIRSMFESWLRHLTCCKTLHGISPEPQFPHLKNGDDDKCYYSRRMVAKIASPWPRVSTQSMLAISMVVVVVVIPSQLEGKRKSKSKSSITNRIRDVVGKSNQLVSWCEEEGLM